MFLLRLKIKSEREILEEMCCRWNLKLRSGSKYTPRNFTAGVAEVDVTRSIGITNEGLKAVSGLLLLM
jgi:hypothetical protein